MIIVIIAKGKISNLKKLLYLVYQILIIWTCCWVSWGTGAFAYLFLRCRLPIIHMQVSIIQEFAYPFWRCRLPIIHMQVSIMLGFVYLFWRCRLPIIHMQVSIMLGFVYLFWRCRLPIIHSRLVLCLDLLIFSGGEVFLSSTSRLLLC